MITELLRKTITRSIPALKNLAKITCVDGTGWLLEVEKIKEVNVGDLDNDIKNIRERIGPLKSTLEDLERLKWRVM